ncbi:MAG: Hsp20/alpha crystallin family protein [Kiritimatiellae bacterium]|nr:Hsp20/alpha crystallin family protein [Kiritimatiellia bacterium]
MIYNDVRFDTGLTDIKEKELENSYEFNFSLPGFSKENIELTVQDNVLQVNAKSDYKAPEGYKLVKSDFAIKDCFFKANIPEKADREAISAKLNNGILTVSIAKKQIQKKVINIGD